MNSEQQLQKTNGGSQEQTPSATLIRNTDILNLWKCLDKIASSRLAKTTGPSTDSKQVEKLFHPEQMVKVVRMKKLLRPDFEELYDLEMGIEEQKKQLIEKTRHYTSKENLSKQEENEMQELLFQSQILMSNWNQKLNKREKALPDFGDLKFPLSSLDGYTLINNPNPEMFWDYLVDLEK